MKKDILVIGGGINGAGVAADAAGRGLSVVLCEMGDLASGTSSASSRLIHGGLRYLENFKFKLVRESLSERRILRHAAPHLIHLQSFVMPVASWTRPYWMLRAGLFMYDHLAYDPDIPSSFGLDPEEIALLGLKPEFTRALNYYDCTEDDSRLVLHVALLAKQHGAEILTRTKVINAQRLTDGWLVTLESGHKIQQIHAKVIVNTSGPWAQDVANNILHVGTTHTAKLVKGSHIIVPKMFAHEEAFLLQAQDGRVVFLIPYLRDFTLIGTTEVVLDHIEQPVTVSDAEIDYLCRIANQFSKHSISPNDIISQYAGIRPLFETKQVNPSKITRDYVIEANTAQDLAPVFSVFGGKITTYRHLAEILVNQLTAYFPGCKPAWTKHAYLPGGKFINQDVENFKRYLINLCPNISAKILIHYVNTYGTRAGEILDNVHSLADLGKHFGALLYQREVDFLVTQEWAQTAEDILWRRGKMGLWFTPEQTQNLEKYLGQ